MVIPFGTEDSRFLMTHPHPKGWSRALPRNRLSVGKA